MSSAGLGLVIEIMVAVLLMLTIGYCIVLNNRLKNLRADEQLLKATIGELIAATKVAERAIIGLKGTTREAEQALTQKLRDAQVVRAELHQLLTAMPRPQLSAGNMPSVAPAAPKKDPASSALLQGLEKALTDQDVKPVAAQDFRVFTRSGFSGTRNG